MMFVTNLRVFLVFPALLISKLAFAQADVADTPPMGWNSYDCFSYAVNESEVKDNAKFMAKNLKKFGWEYVVVDYVWSCPRLNPDFAPNQNPSFSPRLNMDANGRLIPDVARFPSAAGGLGFRPLADSIHKRGLKFGIHLMRGVPKQAAAEKAPILGSRFRCDEIFSTEHPCPWLNHMWGLDMTKPGAQTYLDSLFKLYAQWGVDFVKVDDLSSPYSALEIEGYQKAIRASGRPMVLSLSPGPTPLEQGRHVSQFANLWRLLDDLWDNWDQLDAAFRATADWTPFRGPNHWPDPDMLPLGRLRKFGPNTGPANTDSRLSKDEAQTLMSLWCIAKCPLMFGGNLPETDPFTLSLITNQEALTVNQKSGGSHQLIGGMEPIWTSTGSDSQVRYIGVFNRSQASTSVVVRLSDIGLKSCKVRDLWLHKDLGMATDTVSVSLPAHGSALLRLYVIQLGETTEPILPTLDVSGTSYEAESSDNTLTGQTRVVDDIKDGQCSGEKLVRFIGTSPSNTLRFNKIVAPKDGDYRVSIVYMSGSHRHMNMSVNGETPKSYEYPATGGWDGRFLDAIEVTVHLKQGMNSIEFGNPTDWGVDLDRIIIHS